MAAYAPHYTSRFKQRYSVQGANHSITFRFPGPVTGSGLTDAQNAFASFLNAIAPIMFTDWSMGAASAADIDSTVFLPVPIISGSGGAVSISAREEEERATALTFVARTAGGNPWKFSFFGIAISGLESAGAVDYRIHPGEVTEIDDAVTVLVANASAFVGNDGGTLFWYPYVNYKDYDHWVKEVRG
jgi:hypothetical protein